MNTLYRATLFAGFASIVGMITQIIKGKVLAIVLGPEGMGLLVQLTFLFGLAVTISGMGLQQGVIRYVSEYSSTEQGDKLNSLHSTITIFLVCMACCIVAIGILFSEEVSIFLLADAKYATSVSVILFAVPLSAVANYYQAFLSGLKAVELKTKLIVVSNLVSLPFALLLIYKFNLLGAILSLIVQQTLLTILGWYYAKKSLSNSILLRIKLFNFHYIKINSTYGLVGTGMVLLGLVLNLVVNSMITRHLGVKSTGIFSVTWQISTLYLGIFLGGVSTYYYPVLCELTDNKLISIEVNSAVRHFVKLLTPVVICIICFNVPIITLLFTSDFLQAGKLFAYYMPGDFFRIVSEALGLLLLAKGYFLPYVCLFVLWCGFYLGGICWGIDRFGIEAVAIFYTVSYVVVSVLAFLVIKRIFNFRFEKQTILGMIVSITLIILSSLISLNMNVIFTSCLGVIALYFYSGKEIKELVSRLMNKFRTYRG